MTDKLNKLIEIILKLRHMLDKENGHVLSIEIDRHAYRVLLYWYTWSPNIMHNTNARIEGDKLFICGIEIKKGER